jgi:hypothetical protein
MLKNKHTFYTDYAKENWEPLKRTLKNRKEAGKEEKKREQKDSPEGKKEKEKSDRSVDTLFRVTLNNHTRLSDIADSKANIYYL